MKSRPRILVTLGGQVDKSRVALRVFGDDVDPQQISKLLGHKATTGRLKGERCISKFTGKERIAPAGSWILQAPEAKKASLDRQIAWLFKRLSKRLVIWKRLNSRYRVDIFCGLFLDGFNRGISLSPTTLFELGRRGISISFDIYADCSPEESAWFKKLRRKYEKPERK